MATHTPQSEAADADLLRQTHEVYQQLAGQIGQVIVGQADVVRALLASVFCGGHTLIVGVPGLAKTLLVRTLAGALGWSFRRIQFTPDMMPADILGMELLQDNAESGERRMRFVPGPIFANLVLADEINRTPPKTQSALLEAMQEYTVTSMGATHALERPFIVVATQNPIEQEGTYPLPEAQLDRFMFSLWVDYPSLEQERAIVAAPTPEVVGRPGSPVDVAPTQQIVSRERMLELQSLVGRVPVSSHVVDYAVAITRATRPSDAGADSYVQQYVEWGAGPRAAQHMVAAARAFAALDARPTVAVDHVREAAPLVLRHRVLPNYNATGDGLAPAAIVEHVLDSVQQSDYEAGER